MSRVWKFLLSFILFIVICYAGLTWFVNSEVEKGLNQAVAEVEGLTLNYSNLSVSIQKQCVTLKNVEATLPQGQFLQADTVTITAFDQINPVPHYMTATATNVTIETTTANLGTWANSMQDLNIATIKGDLTLDYRYAPETKTLDIKTLTLKVPELAEAKLSATIDKLDLHPFRMETLIGLRLGKANLTFTNHSLVNTLIRESANGLNVSEAKALTRISAELSAMADYVGKDENRVAENVLHGLRRYINDPGTVTVSSNPTEPVPMLYLFMGRDIYENLRMMNVQIETDSSEEI
jgi:hypothetical protein